MNWTIVSIGVPNHPCFIGDFTKEMLDTTWIWLVKRSIYCSIVCTKKGNDIIELHTMNHTHSIIHSAVYYWHILTHLLSLRGVNLVNGTPLVGGWATHVLDHLDKKMKACGKPPINHPGNHHKCDVCIYIYIYIYMYTQKNNNNNIPIVGLLLGLPHKTHFQSDNKLTGLKHGLLKMTQLDSVGPNRVCKIGFTWDIRAGTLNRLA